MIHVHHAPTAQRGTNITKQPGPIHCTLCGVELTRQPLGFWVRNTWDPDLSTVLRSEYDPHHGEMAPCRSKA